MRSKIMRCCSANTLHRDNARAAEQTLQGMAAFIDRDISSNPVKLSRALSAQSTYVKAASRQPVLGKLFYFLSTGNLVSERPRVMQTSGFTVVADKLNRWRYLSHFRAVHRGQFFTEMKTTAVRKLLPESWGFLCPVHTPD